MGAWLFGALALFALDASTINAAPVFSLQEPLPMQDTLQPVEPVTLPFPFDDADEYDFDGTPSGGLYFSDPPNVTTDISYDPASGLYVKTRRVGDRIIGRPVYMSFEDYLQYDLDRGLQQYWREKATPQGFERRDGVIPEIYIGGELFDRIFGGSTID
ncbi:MAG: hypothetical protein K0B09_14200, partial [Bacteroidales bacterium]|nr:hypothetical protein [Bacteroidales bacterium]